MSSDTFIPMLKELGRLIVFSLPGALILLLTEKPEIAGQYGIAILFVLRAIDKGLHESPETEVKGLVPF